MKNIMKVLNNCDGIKELDFDECSKSVGSKKLSNDSIREHSDSQIKKDVKRGSKLNVNKVSDK